jgi:hypothetical protein
MQYRTIIAASAAAAATAALPFGASAAAATTPEWLTLASAEYDVPGVPAICGVNAAGIPIDAACGGILDTDGFDAFSEIGHVEAPAETGGRALPETPAVPEGHEGYGIPTVANIDLRDFAKWQVCGINVASTSDGQVCDNSIQGDREPVGASDNGISLVNADTTGALAWSVCGISVLNEEPAVSC